MPPLLKKMRELILTKLATSVSTVEVEASKPTKGISEADSGTTGAVHRVDIFKESDAKWHWIGVPMTGEWNMRESTLS